MNRVLIISPTPTHPTNAGNRARILGLVRLLREKRYDVHFLYINSEDCDISEMKKYFGDNLHYFDITSKKVSRSNLGISNIYFDKTISRLKRIIHLFRGEAWKYNRNIDDYYPDGLDTYINEEIVSALYNYVIVEYVVYSRALLNFNSSIKIIDTHDVLSNRFMHYLAMGLSPVWYSLWPKEETKGLNRGDIVWAIQEIEGNHFRQVASDCVVKVFPHINPGKRVKSANMNVLLFIGSHNLINIDALNHFISEVAPILDEYIKDYRVLVAGSIIRERGKVLVHSRVDFYGEYAADEEIFVHGNIFINPVRLGTGLKIKTVDALSSGKCVVSYPCGLEGLPFPDLANPYCLMATSSYDFAMHVLNLLSSEDLVDNYGSSAINFMQSFNSGMDIESLLSLD